MNKAFSIISFLFITSFAIAEESDTLFYGGEYSVIIDSIKIVGNETTEEFIILRELTFSKGDTLTHNLAAYNRERIYSLNIFNEVQLKTYKINELHILIIDIEESWYIYPIPFITLKDRDWNKLSYGVSLSLKNFRGRNETLRGRVAFGFDPSVNFSYLNPNLAYNLNLYLQTELLYTTASNKSEIAEDLAGGGFDQKNYFAGIIFGKRFGLFHRLSLSTAYHYIETPFYIKGINASDNRIDRTFIVGVSYIYDTRDLVQYPSNGIFALLNFEFKGMGINGINYRVADVDFREYRRIAGDLTAKWRIAGRHTGGEIVPFYDYSYLGLSERIRGYFTNQREGNDRIITSVEFNYPIIKETRLNLYFIPLLPKSLLSYRVALIAGLFADSGTTRLENESIGIKNFDTGYGTGVSLLLLPYAIFRLEFAINDKGQTEWIIDLGASF